MSMVSVARCSWRATHGGPQLRVAHLFPRSSAATCAASVCWESTARACSAKVRVWLHTDFVTVNYKNNSCVACFSLRSVLSRAMQQVEVVSLWSCVCRLASASLLHFRSVSSAFSFSWINVFFTFFSMMILGSLFNVSLEDAFQENSSVAFPLLHRCFRELEDRAGRASKQTPESQYVHACSVLQHLACSFVCFRFVRRLSFFWGRYQSHCQHFDAEWV